MSHPEALPPLVQEFCKVTKLPHDPFTKAFLNRCRSHTVKVDGRFYKYFQSGSGPTVLLVHGLHANLGSMVALAEELLEQGYRVVLFDVTGHGEALGTTADPVEIRALMRGMYDRIPALHAVVCHSLGGLWALSAWHEGMTAKAVVSVSAPSTMLFIAEKFAELNGLTRERFQELTGQLEEALGKELWTAYSPLEVVGTIGVPGLIVHGSADDFVPPRHAEDLRAAWPQARLELVEAEGHFDIMDSPRVRSTVSAYLRDVK